MYPEKYKKVVSSIFCLHSSWGAAEKSSENHFFVFFFDFLKVLFQVFEEKEALFSSSFFSKKPLFQMIFKIHYV